MLSIGALSRATGVAVETLRTWERRYGFPEPQRRESGHRRYPLGTVQKLRLMKSAVEMGHKPSSVVGASTQVLLSLLDLAAPRVEGDAELLGKTADFAPSELVANWLRLVVEFDGDGLEQSFRRTWTEFGAVPCLTRAALPFLHEIGNRWRQGLIGIMHEHFASERLRDFLVQQWRPLSDASRGPRVICAALQGERHILGLHMAAVLLALGDRRIVFLGADTPALEVASAAQSFAAAAVVIGASPSADPANLGRQLVSLRQSLDLRTELVVGGTQACIQLSGLRWLSNLESLVEWTHTGDGAASRI